MPLIRKKTSKRITTHKRQRLKHQVAEGKRKKRKEAKKNPQWKSKKKKDPGIPNNFPFKDEILAEIVEQRRQTEENKRKRKEEKKLKVAEDTTQDDNIMDDLIIANSSSQTKTQDEAPLLLNPELPNLRAVIDKSHVVCLVLDARDPQSFRIAHIEDLVSKKKDAKFAFILNKIDLVPRESATAWLKYLRSIYPTFAFRSASAFLPKSPENSKTTTKGKAKESEDDALGPKPLSEYLNQCAMELKIESLQVAIIGIANVGKSSIVNSLLRKATVPVYEYSASAQVGTTTTTRAYEIEIKRQDSPGNIILIDTPGVSLQNEGQYNEDVKVRDILIRCRGRVDKVKEPLPLIERIVSKAITEDLMVHYNLPAFAKGDTIAFLSGIARALNLIRKGGEPDYGTASRSVLRDWNTAKLRFFTDPPASSILENPGEVVLSEDDEKILAKLKTRKEMWKEGGSVKFERGEVEERLVALDAHFSVEEVEGKIDSRVSDPAESVDAQDESEDEEVDEDGSDDHEDGDEEEDEEEDIHLTSRKRKAIEPKASQPSKKVAFAPGVTDHNEKKAARKLQQQQVKEKRRAKFEVSAQKSTGKEGMTKTGPSSKISTKVNLKPASTRKPPPPPPNKSSSKTGLATDPNAYDFDQFFKMT